MSTRLYRSIIVFGAALGTGAVVSTGCDLFTRDDHHVGSGQFGIIDASVPIDGWHSTIADAPWGIIDAPAPIDAAPDAHHPEGDA